MCLPVLGGQRAIAELAVSQTWDMLLGLGVGIRNHGCGYGGWTTSHGEEICFVKRVISLWVNG